MSRIIAVILKFYWTFVIFSVRITTANIGKDKMYRHIKSYELRYTDVDAYDNLKLSSLLSFVEESACLSADELGFGYEALNKKNLGFIIVNNYIKLKRNIKLGEVITIHTWPLKPRLLIFFRDSEIYVGNEKVGVVSARWCMINKDTFVIEPWSVFSDKDTIEYNTERSVNFSSWKIPEISGGKIVYSKRMAYSDYDHNYHVNNTKYADFLMDAFSVDELYGKYPESVQITYVKQCKENEVLDIIRKDLDGYILTEGREDGELRVQMRIKLNDV